MSATEKRSVLRNDGSRSVESLDLPKWDRDGNLIRKPKPKPKPTQVEDVKQETVKVPTVKDVEAIREAAYNEGFEQGYENGLNQGKREGNEQGLAEGKEAGHKEGLIAGEETGRAQALAEEQKKTDEKLAVFESLSDALKNQVALEQSELEQALLTLAVRLARQVVQDELRLKPSHIEAVVHAAVQCLPNPDDKLTVLINPEELEFVSSFADSHWTLQADDSISVGGCKIKSGYSYVDYTLEHRFENAVSHMVANLSEQAKEKAQEPLSEEFLMRPADVEVNQQHVEETQASPSSSAHDDKTIEDSNKTDFPDKKPSADNAIEPEVGESDSETIDSFNSEGSFGFDETEGEGLPDEETSVLDSALETTDMSEEVENKEEPEVNANSGIDVNPEDEVDDEPDTSQ